MKTLKFIFLLICSVEYASGVSFEENKVILSAVKISNEGSPEVVRCTISNQSPFTLASVNLQTHSSEFQFELLDSTGKTVPQDPKWSNEYAQKGSPRYEKPRASIYECIRPGQKIEFDLDLKAAYGDQVNRGKTLKVSWLNIWGEDEIDVGTWKDSNGIETPRHMEKFRFPNPSWELSVSLPLQSKDAEKAAPPASIQETGTPQPPDGQDEPATRKDHRKSASRTHSDTRAPYGSWWWTLLVAPVLFIAWLVFRWKKEK